MTSIGWGEKIDLVKKDMVDPGAYDVKDSSCVRKRGFSFGIGRQVF